jgi:hypothetical protein
MKVYISLLLIFFSFIPRSIYCQCIQNNEFNQYCGTEIQRGDVLHGGPSFSDQCLPGWMPSHGTPQIMWVNFDNVNPPLHNPTDRPDWYVAYMWARYTDQGGGRPGSRGEGILATYQFKRNHTYLITIKYKTQMENPNGASDAEIRLVAVQNLHRPTTWKRGNLRPYGDREQAILSITDRNSVQWKQSQTISYVANDDYNQFWVYAYTTFGNQLNAYIDWVYVCPDDCSGTINYSQGILPNGEPRSGYINMGSSFGGSGIVTVSPTAQTTMIAANEIDIKPEFSATATTGEFWAKIAQCTPPGTRLYNDGNRNENSLLPTENPGFIDDSPEYDSSLVQKKASTNMLVEKNNNVNSNRSITDSKNENTSIKQETTIYPNPTTNKVNILFGSQSTARTKVQLINSVGLTVKYIELGSNGNGIQKITVDMSNLPNDQYLIRIVDDKGNVTIKKIQKLR